MTSVECHTYSNTFCSLLSICSVFQPDFHKPKHDDVEPMSKSPSASHCNSDKLWLFPLSFPLCCCCYHNHSATSSFKCKGLVFFSIHLLEALKSFSTISCLGFLFLCLKMPVGLNCSNALSYELPALSLIYWIYCPIYFPSKINSKKSAGFHHHKGNFEI